MLLKYSIVNFISNKNNKLLLYPCIIELELVNYGVEKIKGEYPCIPLNRMWQSILKFLNTLSTRD